MIVSGGVRLGMKFSTALTKTVTTVALAEFDYIIKVERNRNVAFDYHTCTIVQCS